MNARNLLAAFCCLAVFAGCAVVLGPEPGATLTVINPTVVRACITDSGVVDDFCLDPGEKRVLDLDRPGVSRAGRDPRRPDITFLAVAQEDIPSVCAPRTDDFTLDFPDDRGEWETDTWEIRFPRRLNCDESAAIGIFAEVVNGSCGPVEVAHGEEILRENLEPGKGFSQFFTWDGLRDRIVLRASSMNKEVSAGCERGIDTDRMRFPSRGVRTEDWTIRTRPPR